jgi:hypothetical protein
MRSATRQQWSPCREIDPKTAGKILSKSELARRLGKDEKEVRRNLNPMHRMKLPALESALHALGDLLVEGVKFPPLVMRPRPSLAAVGKPQRAQKASKAAKKAAAKSMKKAAAKKRKRGLTKTPRPNAPRQRHRAGTRRNFSRL